MSLPLPYHLLRKNAKGPNTVLRLYVWAPGTHPPAWQSYEADPHDIACPQPTGSVQECAAQCSELETRVDYWTLWFTMTTSAVLIAAIIGYDCNQCPPQSAPGATVPLARVWPGGSIEILADLPKREQAALMRGCERLIERKNAILADT